MQRTCKLCGFVGEYHADGVGTRARGFHGHVCYACYLEDQRSWRKTELGRQEANDASAAYRSRKRDARNNPRDDLNEPKDV
jgi:hypothetical protein